MPNALNKFTPYIHADSTITSLDARAIGYQYPLVITTSNMDWVPELQNDNLDELKARADGCFGVVDWLQMFCKEFEYAACIPRKDTLPISLQFAWYTPTTADFDIQPGTAFAVGTLDSCIIDGINNLLTIAHKQVEVWKEKWAGKNNIVANMLSSLKHDISVLHRHPLMYRNIIVFIAQVQHSFLDMIAFMDYVEIIQPHLATSSWSSWSLLPGNPKWMEDSKPNDAQRNRDKWEDLCCPENPESIGFWNSAFQKADKDKGHIKQGFIDRRYQFPEPALLITPTLLERKKLFIVNWLAARPLWISRVDHNPPERFPSPQLWRDFLNSSPSGESSAAASLSSTVPTATAKRKQAAKEIFGEDLLDAEGSTWAIQATLVWRNETISVASLSDPPTHLMRHILWELYELNFHYELQALNRVMACASWEESLLARHDLLYSIFPEEGGFAFPIPEGDRGGLWSCEIGDIFPYVDSFCNMLSSWENAPPHFSAPLNASTFNEVMRRACNFYVQCFFNHFGRPPIIPHHFPV
ncbi:hypothetical protein K503DRAFT_805176 [Rhizopogon vinicolor AM-OR11-026]|uniref:Uncharacterized protein n=1 Tax=Rhizopogon vinicolor AM-OR11-026 TaxID=1314800 RepID=A0A1B7MIT5_9AGAM|nr:hypothetical protein K503DRAFT_805176 [Rhizopogon vinicolor AM-OR11-026]